ncbi:MAG TPA: hypothetical protein VFC99_17630 [Acidimicrobiia bacterium]|nr:hypothetical protein [Acidimicrobiia bacterium]
MPTKYPMPIQEAIRDLLMDLVGRSVSIDKTSRLELEDDTVGAVADFVGDDGEVGVALIADLALAASLGASLTMMPATIVKESLRRNRFEEEMLLENFDEVANIMTRLFNTHDTPHLRKDGVYPIPGDVPDPVTALIEQPAARRDFAVLVEGYGDGRLTLVVR